MSENLNPSLSVMNFPTLAIVIDKWHPKTNKLNPSEKVCAVSIRITYMRDRRYYNTGIDVSERTFERYLLKEGGGIRLNQNENELFKRIDSFKNKAKDILDKLLVFSFNKFEEQYFSNRDAANSIFDSFDSYIKELRREGREGTAVSYECARESLKLYAKDNHNGEARFVDVNKKFLVGYENWMKAKGNSATTIGIYLRSLRAIYNQAKVDKSLYPFGNASKDKSLYTIPSGANVKKALSISEIGKIFNYEAEQGSAEEMARDYWVFMYLTNGINVKDLCLLKRKNIDGDVISYVREKTKRTTKTETIIEASIKPETRQIISKWGVHSISPDSYIFPHVKKGMDAKQIRDTVQQLTKTINKYMKRIGKELEISTPPLTYVSRHSFSTVLKRSGASVEFISEALGHKSTTTTQNYLASFERDVIHKTTDNLLSFRKAQ